ncbi:MAG: hypothetical protein JOZ38_01885 [Candidatus Eremiobacteraeota bacterium]|nr:hypothetical protein [Candidatus Eremiobacteraeota bacterium]
MSLRSATWLAASLTLIFTVERAPAESRTLNCDSPAYQTLQGLGMNGVLKRTSPPLDPTTSFWDSTYRQGAFEVTVAFKGTNCAVTKIQVHPTESRFRLSLHSISNWLDGVSFSSDGRYVHVKATTANERNLIALSIPNPIITLDTFAGSRHVSIATMDSSDSGPEVGIGRYEGRPLFFFVQWPEGGIPPRYPVWPDK